MMCITFPTLQIVFWLRGRILQLEFLAFSHQNSQNSHFSSKHPIAPLRQKDASQNGKLGVHRLRHEPAEIFALASLLRRFGKAKSLADGRRVHASIRKCGFDRNTFLGNCLIEMYGNCGSVDEARTVYDRIANPNVHSCNLLIKAYSQSGNLNDANHVFCRMPQKDVVSWNTMIAAFARNGYGKEALDLFHTMKTEVLKPDKITFLCALDACTVLAGLKEGQEIHCALFDIGYEQDMMVGTALINMYGKCGSLHDARNVFHKMPHRDAVAWNAIISTCSQNGDGKKALDFFQQMQLEGVRPDKVSFLCVLDACVTIPALEKGQYIHAVIVDSGYEQDVTVGNTLLNMYGKCKSLYNAVNLFVRILHKNIVTWNAMIAVFSQNMHGKEALDLFVQMQLEGIKPDKVTLVCVLDACASLASLKDGQDIHMTIVSGRYEQDVALGNALIDMYGKCGNLWEARNVFDRMHHHDVVSWTVMIASFSRNGLDMEALDLFYQMQFEGFKPDKTTFICILITCSRAGWVDEGRHFFVSMNKDCGIQHNGDHYVSMIDLLSRSGKLDEAEDLIENMPLEKLGLAWLCLLGAYKIHGDIGRALHAAEKCFKFDPENVAPYVVLSNTYAALGRWDDVAKVRKPLVEWFKSAPEVELYRY